ncbi:hypothetical protein C8R32_102280 [Nitrosospira sp. Nsp5]|nr:hypothetical protein C8R32_102280 [Nitrosospira sp. Nsp5]
MYGTNTGNLFLELENTGPDISGTLRIMDAEHGVAEYSIKGTFDEKLKLSGDPVKGPPDIELGTLTAEAILTPEGNIRGTWVTSIGTGGAFTAYPHHGAYPENVGQAHPPIARQLYTKNIFLGSVRLFFSDVKQLISYIQEDFNSSQPVVTYNVRGSQVTKFAEDFLNEAHSLGPLNYLKITTQEPEPGGYGINRLIVVELNAQGINEVRGQSIQESWVIGKTEATAALLKPSERVLITSYKKFGLGLNHITFLAMLVFMPEIANWKDRALFVSVVFFCLP